MGHLASASAPTHVHTHTLHSYGMLVTYTGSSSTVSGDWASAF